MVTYVAIIGRRENLGIGAAHPKVLTHVDRDALVAAAVAERTSMGGHYDIFIGEITHKVFTPASYKLTPL